MALSFILHCVIHDTKVCGRIRSIKLGKIIVWNRGTHKARGKNPGVVVDFEYLLCLKTQVRGDLQWLLYVIPIVKGANECYCTSRHRKLTLLFVII